ncbi:MAG: hypothetical protein ABI639_07435 [Thermoanaerobaculia bacterium]
MVLSVMQHAAYYDTAWRFAKSRGIPLVVIVHDVNEQFEPVLPIAVAAMRRRDGKFYRFASKRLCVSPQMERLCAELYDVGGDVMYPNRSEELMPRPIEASAKLRSHGRLTVGFVGNPNYGYGDELLRLLPAFRSSCARIILFGHPPAGACRPLLDAADCVDFRGFRPAMEAWRAVQEECDAVILPYPNPAGRMERLYRHHFPSKLTEYLGLGMPVIVTGPEYCAGVSWASRWPDSALVWSGSDPKELGVELARLRDQAERRVALAKGALTSGNAEFDPNRIKEEFLRHLLDASAS